MARITDYLKETRAELRHVNWPTRKQAAVFTVLVVAVSLITAAYLGVFDYVFSRILRLVI
ncbi:MAG: Preprotein translocase subunit SecE [Parcubacteria group bacterium Gr01-1014_17]|nr:MAG: Preprotein translocase subunit SecE [Parcubacteria group bacterium Gr01-1014_17]